MAVENFKAPDQAPEVNPIFGDTSAAKKMAEEVRDQPLPVPRASEDLLGKESVFSDKVGTPKFPNAEVVGPVLLNDRKFNPAVAMKADAQFDAMVSGKGRMSLDALYQIDTTKKVA